MYYIEIDRERGERIEGGRYLQDREIGRRRKREKKGERSDGEEK